jgi:hypothetical protein
MNAAKNATVPARRGTRRAAARLAPPAPRPRRATGRPADLDDRDLFASPHALEYSAGAYTWR